MYTMRDVARLAKVSTATVSAVVNGKKGVRPALVTQVKHAMKALDYHPDHVARSLRVRRTTTIGIVTPTITGGFFTEVIRGAEDAAWNAGYSLLLCNSNENVEQEQRYLSVLFSRRVDGVLLATADPNSFGYRRSQPQVPIVLFDRVPPGYAGPAVVIDNKSAAYEATNYLISLGHHRIAFIAGRPTFSTGFDRAEGFRKAMAEANLPVRADYLKQAGFKFENGYQAGLELLRLEERPTAVFSANAPVTLGFVKAMRDLQVSCPGEVSVIGFDDIFPKDFNLAVVMNPELTVISQPGYQIGCRAIEMLLRMVAEPTESEEVQTEGIVVFKAELCVRNSVAPPAPVRPSSEISQPASSMHVA